MLTTEDNEILNHVGPGTPMGNLLRRYWTPALLSDEIPTPDCTPVEVRLLGEDLVAFRDTEGRVGLVDSCCPHRGSGMFYGRNEESGLRCVYHGWKFDVTGQCVDMPSEPPTSVFKDKLKIPAYPTHESGGVVWTYMGPKNQMTPFRDFGTENLPREEWYAKKTFEPMTWMQWMEGLMDSTHNSWLHGWKGAIDLEDDGSDAPGSYNGRTGIEKIRAFDKAPRIHVIETWHGFRAVALRDTPKGNTHARLYAFVMPYLCGPGGRSWIVPIDDDTCYDFRINTVNDEMLTQLTMDKGKTIPMAGDPFEKNFAGRRVENDGQVRNLANKFLIERDLQKDGTIFAGIANQNAQDIMARQTSYTDRTKEHLGSLDRKIILVRRMLINAAKNLAKGIEPPVLDPSLPYEKIGSPSKVLSPGEDWTVLGSELDPIYASPVTPAANPPTIAT
jgi:phenylpropionate dioxygenase-like ring-hydroxylating dioxygenase large terminal subunit